MNLPMLLRRLAAPIVVATVGGVALTGCGIAGPAGDPVTQEREVDAVTSVVLTTSGTLVVTLGDTPRLSVTAGENTIDKMTTRSTDGVLILGKNRGANLRGDMRYELTVPALTSVTVDSSGSAEVDLTGTAGPTLTSKGSGRIDARNLDAQTLTVQIDGSGTVTTAGRAARQTVTVGGSGRYAAYELASEQATVTVRGSGKAEVQATGALKADVDGSGSVTYRGEPQVDQTVDGTGSVRQG
ncbi:head GIN domain-containing protein [Micromonospora sp. SH-82]|uniref:head GIN domain-containing protein n=1 Tax=Micromonospora sp. SH-82 TaxID=3132938 RepID=UPI003EBB014D